MKAAVYHGPGSITCKVLLSAARHTMSGGRQ